MRSHSLLEDYSHAAYSKELLVGLSTGNLSALADLDQILHDLIFLSHTRTFFDLDIAAMSLMGLLMLVGSVIIVLRTIQGKFWMVRLMRRVQGTYVVPNALNSFIMWEGAFGAVWIAYAACSYMAFSGTADNLAWAHRLEIFNVLVWLPLYLGAFYATIGSLFAVPGALDDDITIKKSPIRYFLGHPILINGLSIGVPVLLCASTIPMAIFAQDATSAAIYRYELFNIQMRSVTEYHMGEAIGYLNEASFIWDSVAEGKKWTSIAFYIWSGFDGLLVMLYVPALVSMLFMLRKQLRAHDKHIKKLEQQEWELLAFDDETKGTAVPVLGSGAEGRGIDVPGLLFMPNSDMVDQEMTVRPTSPFGSPDLSGKLGKKPSKLLNKSLNDENYLPPDENANRDYFFPPLKKTEIARNSVRLSKHAPPMVRRRYISRAFWSLLLFGVALLMGSFVFWTNTTRLAATIEQAYLSGPTEAADLDATWRLIAAYASAIFGALTLIAVACRFLDPTDPTKDAEEKPGKGKRRASRKQSLVGGLFGRSSFDTSSRTLPSFLERSQTDTRGDFDCDLIPFDGEIPVHSISKKSSDWRVNALARANSSVDLNRAAPSYHGVQITSTPPMLERPLVPERLLQPNDFAQDSKLFSPLQRDDSSLSGTPTRKSLTIARRPPPPRSPSMSASENDFDDTKSLSSPSSASSRHFQDGKLAGSIQRRINDEPGSGSFGRNLLLASPQSQTSSSPTRKSSGAHLDDISYGALTPERPEHLGSLSPPPVNRNRLVPRPFLLSTARSISGNSVLPSSPAPPYSPQPPRSPTSQTSASSTSNDRSGAVGGTAPLNFTKRTQATATSASTSDPFDPISLDGPASPVLTGAISPLREASSISSAGGWYSTMTPAAFMTPTFGVREPTSPTVAQEGFFSLPVSPDATRGLGLAAKRQQSQGAGAASATSAVARAPSSSATTGAQDGVYNFF